uniref:Putative calcineurin-like phosphoesterase n=1 Tax=viral metagenome TaxID=1070528 RepID=A0A6M3IM51_9ZZZZ
MAMTKRIIHREKYNAVLGADLHLREDVPVCRTDDYLAAQFKKMSFVKDLCEENDCPFLVAGDVFDHWKPSPYLLSRAIELLPHAVVVAGQHDLPQHSFLELSKTGLNTLVQARTLDLALPEFQRTIGAFLRVYGTSYGQEPLRKTEKDPSGYRNVLLWHRLVTSGGDQPWPGAGADDARKILKSLPEYDLIVTGDNHQQFTVELDGRVLVNPGSTMRMTADQADFEPAVFGWKSSDNSVTRIPLPIQKGVVSREHLKREKKEDRDLRMEVYIQRAKRTFEHRLSFEKNLEEHFRKNDEDEDVKRLVWEAVEKEDAS